ncbi:MULTISPECIES: GGDEF domain-containing protein [unclassified Chelatococcus]|uniref:GGDEF domain-containing protein n=1 Tax=unclassified Chelatococcus TaxID=2638111 RepID=UPI001BD03735|nr:MULTISPECIES: GGDEF domain-containing protein [unclassified Chelatococcus]MBS7699940.1 GGDEF domain-containing protein [Chelatococcus sp. YT9]MBX3558635.1 GGDEF domain-containing protein [Chelatococcus sp.]
MIMPANPLVLIGPTILLIFAVAFTLTWRIDQHRNYLLYFGVSALFFCLGSLSQILAVPRNVGFNAVVSAFIYTSSVLLACQGLLIRSGAGVGWRTHLILLISIVTGIAYFFYVDRNVVIRIYILNYGFGLIFLATAWKIRHLRSGRLPERVLLWVLVAFGFHFFPRTILTVQPQMPAAREFASSTFWLALQFSLAALGVILALSLLAVAVSDVVEDLRRERVTDPLTGLFNRRGLEEAHARVRKDRSAPLSVVIGDIDHFKSVNDTLGHATGDRLLREFGRLLMKESGAHNLCVRLGGEEFLVLLPATDFLAASQYAERIREAVRSTHFVSLPRSWQLTASFGVAQAEPSEDLDDTVNRADLALYMAKQDGRNRVGMARPREFAQGSTSSAP